MSDQSMPQFEKMRDKYDPNGYLGEGEVATIHSGELKFKKLYAIRNKVNM